MKSVKSVSNMNTHHKQKLHKECLITLTPQGKKLPHALIALLMNLYGSYGVEYVDKHTPVQGFATQSGPTNIKTGTTFLHTDSDEDDYNIG